MSYDVTCIGTICRPSNANANEKPVKFTEAKDGKSAAARFRITTPTGRKGQDGQSIINPCNCTVFGKTAEILKDAVAGDKYKFTGEMVLNEPYKDRNGNERNANHLYVDRVEYVIPEGLVDTYRAFVAQQRAARAQAQYNAPPQGQAQYSAPPQGQAQYSAPPAQAQYSAPPQGQAQYSAPPAQAQYSAPPQGQAQYSAPPQGQAQYSAPPAQAQYNAPPVDASGVDTKLPWE